MDTWKHIVGYCLFFYQDNNENTGAQILERTLKKLELEPLWSSQHCWFIKFNQGFAHWCTSTHTHTQSTWLLAGQAFSALSHAVFNWPHTGSLAVPNALLPPTSRERNACEHAHSFPPLLLFHTTALNAIFCFSATFPVKCECWGWGIWISIRSVHSGQMEIKIQFSPTLTTANNSTLQTFNQNLMRKDFSILFKVSQNLLSSENQTCCEVWAIWGKEFWCRRDSAILTQIEVGEQHSPSLLLALSVLGSHGVLSLLCNTEVYCSVLVSRLSLSLSLQPPSSPILHHSVHNPSLRQWGSLCST